ncbi:protein of unknown function [Azospirillum lipoferum 4B]|uniref:Uncharacterized protein n=1 Tax=Azospirillum lipoferum (strain 4B) TaxID=862719 RepID=G7Z2J0_AZOL4|nr:protein of unknown function [Azospirillum lipoferum 4B]
MIYRRLRFPQKAKLLRRILPSIPTTSVVGFRRSVVVCLFEPLGNHPFPLRRLVQIVQMARQVILSAIRDEMRLMSFFHSNQR